MICDQCTEPAMAIAPGTAPVRDLFLLSRGEPMRCWCLCHWAEAHRALEEEKTHDCSGETHA